MTNVTKLLTTITVAAVISGVGVAAAESGRETFSIEFRYNTAATVQQNYSRFLHEVRDVCTTDGLKPVAQVMRERACVQDVMDQLVTRMGRADLASVHAERTGRQIAAPRDFAAK